ncbi:hypothetical protein EXIGLDRAFT_718313 [Exidia glandulosa HHB12029]|uniref:Chromo domain-containing protein n=1 Tax=Exidia glandulosa HHB12029 TaxID=1314781 RepID=A0A165HT12_EXIGL|nr:hypothetical protein EXIGLDRAFT_718313 [Exidia glandulosa HHB12029]
MFNWQPAPWSSPPPRPRDLLLRDWRQGSESDDEDYWEMDCVIDIRLANTQYTNEGGPPVYEYLVTWKGFGREDATWQLVTNLPCSVLQAWWDAVHANEPDI